MLGFRVLLAITHIIDESLCCAHKPDGWKTETCKLDELTGTGCIQVWLMAWNWSQIWMTGQCPSQKTNLLTLSERLVRENPSFHFDLDPVLWPWGWAFKICYNWMVYLWGNCRRNIVARVDRICFIHGPDYSLITGQVVNLIVSNVYYLMYSCPRFFFSGMFCDASNLKCSLEI